ncbi:MAG: PQQ-binding-like beta-propeller repeat protein [Planctomycetes bacterium]|nr:PQQ-binding-like beta-propeller repeat protein [Planctomycetota bacterium]
MHDTPHHRTQALGLLLAFALSSSALLAQQAQPQADWPAWRGTDGTGSAREADPPIRWSETENIAWKIALPGHGKSTPIVVGSRLFLLAAEPGAEASAEELAARTLFEGQLTEAPSTKLRFHVLAFDRTNGKQLWQRTVAERLPVAGIHETNGYASFSPVADGERVYASFGSYGVHALDAQSGEVLWTHELGPQRLRRGWGEAGSPALRGDTLVVVADQEANSYIVALDARNGEVRWKRTRDEVSTWTTPLVVDGGGTTQVIVNGTNAVRSYSLASGEELWSCGGQTVNAIPSVVSDGALAFALSGYQGQAGAALRLDRRGDLKSLPDGIAWTFARGTPYVPSPLLAEGRLYFLAGNSGLLTCLDAKTGAVQLDRERLELASVYASPLFAGGRLYVVGRDGTTIVLRHGEKLEVLAVNALADGIDASPVAIGKTLYLRSDRQLYALRDEGR